jgi:hypothetical protein
MLLTRGRAFPGRVVEQAVGRVRVEQKTFHRAPDLRVGLDQQRFTLLTG